MAGLNTIQDAFDTTKCNMPVCTPGGYPAFSFKKADGEYDVSYGTWDSLDREERKAVPPVVKGATEMNQCFIGIRVSSSPDAKNFCVENGVDMEAEMKGKRSKLSNMERGAVLIASCIVDFTACPFENKEKGGATELLRYSPKVAIQFVKEFSTIANQIEDFLRDTKKFDLRR